jgi:hypothetical protein
MLECAMAILYFGTPPCDTSQCQCAHDGVDCTYSKIAGTCYAGICNGYSLLYYQ